MRVRRNAAILGIVIILFGCVTLYLMTDLTFPQRSSSINPEYQNNKWLRFEDRLKRLESGLNKHNEAVGEIKNAIQQLKPPVNSPDIKDELPNFDVPSVTNVSVMKYTNECPIQITYSPKTNIQMLELYKELKFDNPDGGAWKQGFRIKYVEEQWNKHQKLKVFVVPHSHNDPGWIKTFTQYFESQTRQILNNMVDSMEHDEKKKFIWAEVSFLALWWAEIDTEKKRTVRSLTENGQLEIVTGGWVMNDEANTHWQNMVLQLTEGHQWLSQNLNFTPSNGWTIDPFGMSPTMALLLREAGIENLAIQRVHYAVKKQFAKNKQLEFKWRQLWDGTGTTDLFTHMMPFYSYDIPHTCGPDPKICCQFDFHRLPGRGLSCPWRIPPQVITENNVQSKAILLLDQYRKKAQLYQSNVVLAPLGDDFRYDHISEWTDQFGNYKKLMNHMNTNDALNVQIQFGTLKDFFNAVREEKSVNDFPTLSGDFFTYADRDDHYWSGYYTSRPFYKRMDRILMSYLRAAEVLVTLAATSGLSHSSWILSDSSDIPQLLSKARQSLSLFQHHDGVTGTAKKFVMADYGKRMLTAINYTQHVIQHAANVLLSKSITTPHSEALYFNMDDNRALHNALPTKTTIEFNAKVKNKQIVLYNSLTFSRQEVVTFHVSTPYIFVQDSEGNFVECQISPVFQYDVKLVVHLLIYEVAFVAVVPALGLATYTITSTELNALPKSSKLVSVKVYNYRDSILLPEGFPKIEVHSTGSDSSIQNSKISASFNNHGLLKAIRVGSKTMPIHLDFMKYGARKSKEMSGAYIFLPDGEAEPLRNRDALFRITEGEIYSSVTVYLPLVEHTVYLFESSGADSWGLELRNVVDISETSNFELIMRLSTNIQNGDDFFTDLNGLQMIRRKKFTKLPLQANYYPLPNMAYIEDDTFRLTLITASALGVASLHEGQIEIMQDRRLMQDDNRGLFESVLDNLPTSHTFRILLQKRNSQTCKTTPEKYPAGFPTVSAQLASTSLLNPIYRLISVVDGVPYETGYRSVEVEPGVDISLSVLRTSVFAKRSTDNIGIVLHRQHLDVCFENGNTVSNTILSDGTVNILSLLPRFSKMRLYNSSLTYLKIGAEMDIKRKHAICPMSINTYLLQR